MSGADTFIFARISVSRWGITSSRTWWHYRTSCHTDASVTIKSTWSLMIARDCSFAHEYLPLSLHAVYVCRNLKKMNLSRKSHSTHIYIKTWLIFNYFRLPSPSLLKNYTSSWAFLCPFSTSSRDNLGCLFLVRVITCHDVCTQST